MDELSKYVPEEDPDWESKITGFWDRLAPKYMEYTERYLGRNSWVNERLQVLFPGMRNLRIADIGTGCGFLAISYAQLGHTVTATDISDGMLEHARTLAERKGVSVEFVKDDAMHTGLPEDHFDLVVLRDVFCSVKRPFEVLQSLSRIVRPGGYLMISDGHYFRYLHDPDYADRQRYFTMKLGRGEFESMIDLEPDAYRELEHLIGNLEVNRIMNPYWETKFMLEIGFNNVRVRADDWDDYNHLTEYGPMKVPLRYTFSAQKLYYGGGESNFGKNSKSFLYRDKVQGPDVLGKQFMALAHEDRIRLLDALSGGIYRVRDLADMTGMSENRASYHLGILSEAGFVKAEKRGRETLFRIKDDSAVEHLMNTVSQLYQHR